MNYQLKILQVTHFSNDDGHFCGEIKCSIWAEICSCSEIIFLTLQSSGDVVIITAATSCLGKHSPLLNRNLVSCPIRLNQDHTWGVTLRRGIWLDELSLFWSLLMSLRGLMMLLVTWPELLTYVNWSLPHRVDVGNSWSHISRDPGHGFHPNFDPAYKHVAQNRIRGCKYSFKSLCSGRNQEGWFESI